ncbi:helix-turn-helix domain-containing protein [Streptomyces sp. NBC_01235]|uniref:helix-turn-helix domain-containing protein n=1 Tax=Streptomyces sp. NBC_01235 TaxID=2903788 RepID=UPI002E10BAF2|nr:TetR/AcrR family transcriptional regulator [Streptomyces sp. NBC_01235]
MTGPGAELLGRPWVAGGTAIAAERRVFARDGEGASMASVAREAGVGIASVFRRLPTKEELVATAPRRVRRPAGRRTFP